jgi:hypothetical protein
MSQKNKAASSPEAAPEPVDVVVARLSALLTEAKAGNLRAVAIAFVTRARPYTGSASAVSPGDIEGDKLLTAAITELRHEWLHAARGK